jgi:hypothetical protein
MTTAGRGTTRAVLEAATRVARCEHGRGLSSSTECKLIVRDRPGERFSLPARRCRECGSLESRIAVPGAPSAWLRPRMLEELAACIDDAIDLASCLPPEAPPAALRLADQVEELARLAASYGEDGMASRLRAAREVVRDFAASLALQHPHERHDA